MTVGVTAECHRRIAHPSLLSPVPFARLTEPPSGLLPMARALPLSAHAASRLTSPTLSGTIAAKCLRRHSLSVPAQGLSATARTPSAESRTGEESFSSTTSRRSFTAIRLDAIPKS